MMEIPNHIKYRSAIFITFSGNCRKALTFYQTCFGGTLAFETFKEEIEGYTDRPVITGCLVSDNLIIYGSDLVHNEGRTLGNYLSIFLQCNNTDDRQVLIEKLKLARHNHVNRHGEDQKLVELTDAFDVQWVLGV